MELIGKKESYILITMGSKKELTPQERREIINKHLEGLSYQKIAGKNISLSIIIIFIKDLFEVSKTAVPNTVIWYNKFNSVESRPRSGKPKKFNEHDNRMVKLLSVKNPELSSADILQQINEFNI